MNVLEATFMTSEAKLGCCKICGNKFHRAWKCPKKPRTKKIKARTSQTLSKKDIIAKFDIVFSKYIRYKQLEDLGYNQCFTCNKILQFNETCAAHYINRRFLATRYDEDNVKPSCYICNGVKNGELEIFRSKLGELADELEQRKNSHLSSLELDALYKDYLRRLKKYDK